MSDTDVGKFSDFVQFTRICETDNASNDLSIKVP